MNELPELHRRARELADLNGIGGLLLWDQNTMMPPGGADARADQFEALERIQHSRLTDPQLGRILDELEPWAASEDPDSDDVRLIAVLKRDHEKAVRVPTDLAAEMSGASAHAQQSWLEAREKASFKPFAPALEHLLGAPAAVHRVLRRHGRVRAPVRHPARRLRARPHDRGAARAVHAHPEGARPARLGGRGGGGGRPRLPGPLPDGAPATVRARSSCTPSATTPSTGAWTRRCTRSRARWRTPTCGSRRAGSPTTSRWRSTPACTSSGTACTRRRCRPRTTGRRSPTPPASAPTSPRAGCGRTSSAAASRSPSGSCRSCSATSGTRSTPGTSTSSTAPSTRCGSR